MITRALVKRYSFFVLCYTVLVIIWGAYVRATGSGAGCGRHWPLCNGTVVPGSNNVTMMIEFSHRLSSGLSLVFVCVLLVLVFKAYSKGHAVRGYALLSLVFILAEALIGAGLVLFELVAENSSLIRAVVMAMHLVNTYVLLYGLCAVYWFSDKPDEIRSIKHVSGLPFWLSLIFLVVVAATGAVTALGDTLIMHLPAFERQNHILVQLRVIHPVLASITAMIVGMHAASLYMHHNDRVHSLLLVSLLILQVICGVLNIVWQVPVAMQLLHLFLADLIWIVFLCSGFVLAQDDEGVRSMNRQLLSSP